MSIIEEKETRDRLLASVKKEVKQLMEEAVTKKFVHEDSSCITSLCATIETCLLHGLKRRSIGLFKTSTTMALVEKLGKNFEPAQVVVKLCNDYDEKYCNNQNPITKKLFNNQTIYDKDSNFRGRNFVPTFYKGSNCYKFLWIRLALLNKMLNKIIDHIIQNSGIYYAPYALIADPVDGPIFSSLLVGPCALEFTKLKTCDHLWSDPNADELIQRYRMHNLCNQNSNQVVSCNTSLSSNSTNTSNNSNTFYYQLQSPKLKLGLNASIILKRNASTSNISVDDQNSSLQSPNLVSTATTNTVASATTSIPSPLPVNSTTANNLNVMKTPLTPSSINSTGNQSPNASANLNSTTNNAKEYVESLHQNSKSQLIYGKNYVVVYPKEEMDGLPGYLSLHLNPNNSLTLKWTPNQLMNGSIDESSSIKPKNAFWDYAINVDISNIVYLHCHQHATRGATIVLVGQDGVQYPPICFPKGSHLLQFLVCLENGLLPYGILDPPLWNEEGKGKVLPKLRQLKNQDSQQKSKCDNNNNDLQEDDYEPKDFIFRIGSSSESSNNNSNNNTNNIFRSFFNSNNPISSIFSTFSSNDATTNSNSNEIKKPSNSSTSSASSDGSALSYSMCPPTPPTSTKSNSSSISSLQSSAIIGPKELANQVTPSSIFTDNNRPKICKSVSVRSSMKLLCDTMKRQIVSRAFYGWLAYCRHLKTIRLHLVGLVHLKSEDESEFLNEEFSGIKSLTIELWTQWLNDEKLNGISLKKYEKLVYELIYINGCKTNELREKVWPFLLKHYTFDMNAEERFEKDVETKTNYSNLILEWKIFEDYIRLRDQQQKSSIALDNISTSSLSAPPLPTPTPSLASNENKFDEDINNDNKTSTCIVQNLNKEKQIDKDLNLTPIVSTTSNAKLIQVSKNSNILRNDLILLRKDSSLSNDVFMEDLSISSSQKDEQINDIPEETLSQSQSKMTIVNQNVNNNENNVTISSRRSSTCSYLSFDEDNVGDLDTTSHDIEENTSLINQQQNDSSGNTSVFTNATPTTTAIETTTSVNNNSNNIKSLDNKELLENFAVNIHRIDKDVTRCDRNYFYFTSNENLQKLRNIMYTYVWENLNIGYIQGMCDLVAPLLVIFDDEAMAYSCFKQLMQRMAANFPHGNAMDKHFSNMRSLIQILDSNLFEHMHQRGDYTHFYFSYRWFLLDFKRELLYDDIFMVWETIWSAQYVCSEHFSLFIALALVEAYRDIIIDNNMDFTDIIKFFNEMAEKHNAQQILNLARDLVKQLQNLISNKDEF